jgi:DNA-directed RNA polymerase specialized sigma24 family protein
MSDLVIRRARSECYPTGVSWRRDGPSSGPIPEERLRLLLAEDPQRGWRAFIDGYTPMLLALVERAGIVDRDEAMEVYVQACERLATGNYAALRRRDPSLGSLKGWLAVIVRRAAVDWIRSRAGRRRMFAAIRELDRFDQRLFELFYWDGRRPSEAAELLSVEMKQEVTLDLVFEALERIDSALSARHRTELLSLAARSHAAVSLEGGDETTTVDPPAPDLDPEALLRARERNEQLTRALATLPAEDAVIVSLKFVEGLTRAQIQRLLRLPELTEHRVRTIVATLRARLAEAERGQPRASRTTRTMPTIPGIQDV